MWLWITVWELIIYSCWVNLTLLSSDVTPEQTGEGETIHRKAKRRKEDGVYSGKHRLSWCAVRWKRRKIEAAVKDNVSPPPFPLSFSPSEHALNNLKLYSTAGDKANQTAEAPTETEADEGRNITARYVTLCDKQNMQRSSSTQRGRFPRLLFRIKL